MSTVKEIKVAIDKFSPVDRREHDNLLQDLSQADQFKMGSSELEAELLKAIRGPHALFSKAQLREIADRALRDHNARCNG